MDSSPEYRDRKRSMDGKKHRDRRDSSSDANRSRRDDNHGRERGRYRDDKDVRGRERGRRQDRGYGGSSDRESSHGELERLTTRDKSVERSFDRKVEQGHSDGEIKESKERDKKKEKKEKKDKK